LVKPNHLKLRAKFVDVIKTYLRSDFFDDLDKIYTPVGTVDPQTHRVNIKDWKPSEARGFGSIEQLERYVKNIYDTRSSFVHAGVEFPFAAKTDFGILAGNKLDVKGNPIKKSDGSYAQGKQIPSYFWFERVMNSVIHNIIMKFGKENNDS
jgi:hypothetical protein